MIFFVNPFVIYSICTHLNLCSPTLKHIPPCPIPVPVFNTGYMRRAAVIGEGGGCLVKGAPRACFGGGGLTV